jgi:hypothetical protein
VVGRIHEDHVLLDLRTVEPEFDPTLASLLQQIAAVVIAPEKAASW